jgi:hypothetical protein
MTIFGKTLVAAAAIGGLAAPALAQYPNPYPQPYPQPYGQQYPQGYQQQGYGQNPIQQIVDQLLGNRYNVTDRTAVQQCATAAMAQASAQYRRPGYGNGYNQNPPAYGGYPQYNTIPYGQQGYGQPGYAAANAYGARVTAITDVQRRNNGLRVSGVIDSGRFGAMRNSQGYYGQQGYGSGMASANALRSGDLTFRCNVDYRGAVTELRVRQNAAFRR